LLVVEVQVAPVALVVQVLVAPVALAAEALVALARAVPVVRWIRLLPRRRRWTV